MTFDEMLVTITDRRIIRHQSKCFFCVYDAEEAARFKELGAYVMPAGGSNMKLSNGQPEWGAPCWEVHFTNMLDPMIEEIDGEEADVRAPFLLNYFRERDGFEEGLERILA